ncbi:MAG: hypothetical protein DLM50_07280 [Candidatus Meridianibacter frigidus]|nr:MAG: hypothetical protein DLM50_07280 [Candidatus Eremiobacteraeota bacterium]
MSARSHALAIVRDVFAHEVKRRRPAQASLDYHVRKAGLDDRDRAFVTELAYGAIKMRRLLDWYLAPHLSQRQKALPPVIDEILRLAVYELRFMRSPARAVVHDWVGLAKIFGHRGTAGLTNAVLRAFLRSEPPAPKEADFQSRDEFLGVAFSFPKWVIRQWREIFGDDRVAEITQAVNQAPQCAVSVNTLRNTRDQIAAWFASNGVQATPSPYVEEILLVSDSAFARAHEAGHAAEWFSQDEAAAMPVAIANPQPEETVLDLCSGRGNKAVQAAIRMGGRGRLLCVEKDIRKIRGLQARLATSDLQATVIEGDATQPLQAGPFDRIILDAPCSGVGVLGRHPEARWRKSADDGARLGALQRAMLEAAAQHVFPGGALVYSVCSTDPRETTEIIEPFLRSNKFARGLVPAGYEEFQNSAGDVVIPPGVNGRGGFYIARLERSL